MWYIYIHIYLHVPYIHNPESTWKILWIQLKKGNGRLGNLALDTLDSSMMKEKNGCADKNSKGKKPVYIRSLHG